MLELVILTAQLVSPVSLSLFLPFLFSSYDLQEENVNITPSCLLHLASCHPACDHHVLQGKLLRPKPHLLHHLLEQFVQQDQFELKESH